MRKRTRFYPYLLAAAALILLLFLVNRFVFKGSGFLNESDRDWYTPERTGLSIFRYEFFPFQELPSSPKLPGYEDWVVSHPFGLGFHEGIESIEFADSKGISSVEIRVLYQFKEGYEPGGQWREVIKDRDKFIPAMKFHARFTQLRIKTGAKPFDRNSDVSIRVKSHYPMGLSGLLWDDIPPEVKADDKPFNPLEIVEIEEKDSLVERPPRSVEMNLDYKTYREINILNGYRFNTVGLLQVGGENPFLYRDIVKRYGSIVHIWKLLGDEELTLERIRRVIFDIREYSPDAVILHEDITASLVAGNRENGGADGGGINLERGILWKAVVLFMVVFVIYGTGKIFGFKFRFLYCEILWNLPWIFLCAVLFSSLLFSTGINKFNWQFFLYNLIVWAVVIFVLEFLRGVIYVSLNRLFKAFHWPEGSGLRIWVMIVLSSALVSLLFAGYPGFTRLEQVLLILTNFITGLFYGYIFQKNRELGLAYFLHLFSYLPVLVLMS